MKFKVSDIIKGKKGNGYVVTNHHMTKAKVLKVYGAYGQSNMKIEILDHVNPDDIGETYDVINCDLHFELLYDRACIVIYRNGSEVIALNKTTKEKAVAKCSPEDTFDFNTGAKIALGRLIGENLMPEPKLYNGKVVCIKNDSDKRYFTVGKVYAFKNGNTLADDGTKMFSKPAASFAEVNRLRAYQFAELIEEE